MAFAAHRFASGPAVQLLGSAIPENDGAVEALDDDRRYLESHCEFRHGDRSSSVRIKAKKRPEFQAVCILPVLFLCLRSSPTFLRRSSRKKGLGRKRAPAGIPFICFNTSSACPEMKMAAILRRSESAWATSKPLALGIMISEINRSIGPSYSFPMRMASPPSTASRIRYPVGSRNLQSRLRTAGLSSASSTVATSGDSDSSARRVPAPAPTRGIETVKVLPCPGSLSTLMLPPESVTML